jgi:tetratricopeptide (TPR) repeat protein
MLLCFAGSALADDWADCDQQAELDRTVSGCSNIIGAARDGPQKLALAYVNRGLAYLVKGDYDRALADETKAIELNPQLADAYVNRGSASGSKGDYDREIADETKAIELNPQLADAYTERGIAYSLKGDYDRAIADYAQAIELNPQDLYAYQNRGVAHKNKGDYDRAIADYDQAIRLKPEGYFYYSRGSSYAAKGDPAKALSDFRTAARLLDSDQQWRDKALAKVAEIEKQLGPAASATIAAAPAPMATAAAAAPTPPAAGARRVALVIGNSAYQNVAQLTNPANDAKLIADALTEDGFAVTRTANLDRDGLIKALRAFASEADNADWAVVYFAGHGIEMAGTNYLLPVDAKLLTDRDVDFEAVPIGQVMSAIDGAHQLRMVILDACRRNPFAVTLKRTAGESRDVGRGLARIEPTRGTEVVFSAKEGTIAADGDGADSPFATALARHLIEPGVEVDKLFRLVRDDVLDATGNEQEPFVYGSLPGRQDFFFRPN